LNPTGPPVPSNPSHGWKDVIFDVMSVSYSAKSHEAEHSETLMLMLMSGVGQDDEADLTEFFAL